MRRQKSDRGDEHPGSRSRLPPLLWSGPGTEGTFSCRSDRPRHRWPSGPPQASRMGATLERRARLSNGGSGEKESMRNNEVAPPALSHNYVNSNHCRECKSVWDRNSHRENRERHNERSRVYHLANRERILENKRTYWVANRETRIAYSRAYHLRNPEIQRVINQRRRARKRAVLNVPFTHTELAARMAYWGNRCWMCLESADSIDHVIPLACGGAHCLSNLRPACRTCNRRKGAKLYVA